MKRFLFHWQIRIIPFLAIICFTQIVFPQTLQQGRTVEYNGKNAKTPLGGVQIIAGGAYDISDRDGRFTLDFTSLQNGASIRVIKIAKDGYVLFNKDAVDNWQVNDKIPFEIVLCEASHFDEMVAQYYNVSYKSYKEQYDSECARVRIIREQNKIQESEYQKQLSEITDAYQTLLSQIDKHAETMARIDLTSLSQVERDAIGLAQRGALDSAILLLESLSLPDKIEKTMGKLKEGKNLVSAGDSVLIVAKRDFQLLLSQKKTLLNLYLTEGGLLNFKKAEALYIEIAMADTTNSENQLDCGYFLIQQNKFSQAEPFLKRALNSESPFLWCEANCSLGILYFYRNQYEESVKCYKNCLRYYDVVDSLSSCCSPNGIDSSDRYVIVSSKSNILINLGNAYLYSGKYDQAKDSYKLSIKLKESLNLVDDETMTQALINLGNLYYYTTKYKSAIKNYERALEIIRKDSTTTIEIGMFSALGELYNNLGSAYERNGDLLLGDKYMSKAIEHYKGLFEQSPQQYAPFLAMGMYNLGSLHESQQRIAQTDRDYRESLKYFQQIEDVENGTYLSEYAESCKNIGMFYSEIRNDSLAIVLLTRAIRLYDKLSVFTRQDYSLSEADIHFVLGDIFFDYREKTDYLHMSQKHYKSALKLYKKLNKQSGVKYNGEIKDIERKLKQLH